MSLEAGAFATFYRSLRYTEPPTAPAFRSNFCSAQDLLKTFDKRVPDGKQDAVDFLNTAEDIVRCLVATGQREIPAALRELATLPQNDPSMFNFTVGMLDFFEDGLRQFMGRSAFPQELRDMCRGGILGFYRRKIG